VWGVRVSPTGVSHFRPQIQNQYQGQIPDPLRRTSGSGGCPEDRLGERETGGTAGARLPCIALDPLSLPPDNQYGNPVGGDSRLWLNHHS
jgi:hypothetical protein